MLPSSFARMLAGFAAGRYPAAEHQPVVSTRNALTGETEITAGGVPIEFGSSDEGFDQGTAVAFSASGSISNGPAKLVKLRILTGSGLTLTLNDNPTSAVGTVIFTGSALSALATDLVFPSPYQLINGCYASVTGAGTFEAYFK